MICSSKINFSGIVPSLVKYEQGNAVTIFDTGSEYFETSDSTKCDLTKFTIEVTSGSNTGLWVGTNSGKLEASPERSDYNFVI